INHEQHYRQPTTADETIELGGFVGEGLIERKSPVRISNWQVLNISAGGTALRKFPTVSAQVRIGELLSVKNENEKTWAVAVLRWASNGGQEQLDIGTQLIAPYAKAGGTRVLNGDLFEPALILPAMPAIKQTASLITRCGFYAPARILELDENGIVSRIMITKLVERTRSFERFQFSVL
ncbi:MAG: hypothetical protein Q8J65_00230, partial [Nitrosomonadales bacterium]|nr:hypothetical protein [Nitrosomonadales bacterium]